MGLPRIFTRNRGLGVRVAVVDTGVDGSLPAFNDTIVSGWSVSMLATGHGEIGDDFSDDHGHGTSVALALVNAAPHAELQIVKICGASICPTGQLIAGGIDTAVKAGAKIVIVALGTSDMVAAQTIRDACTLAEESGTVVIGAIHPMGLRSYPADLDTVLSVGSHRDIERGKVFFLSKDAFSEPAWRNLSGTVMGCGWSTDGEYLGGGLAAAAVGGMCATVVAAMPHACPSDIRLAMERLAAQPSATRGFQ